MADKDQQEVHIPVWVPPGEHDRPKPGTPEWDAEMQRASQEGRQPWSGSLTRTRSPSSAPGDPGREQRNGGVGADAVIASVGQAWTSGGQDPSLKGGVDAASVQVPPGAKSSAASRPSGKSSWVKTTVIATAVVIMAGGGLYGGYRLFVSFLEWTATKVPISWDVQLGRNAARDVLGRYEVCANPRLNRFIRRLGRRLESGMSDNPYHFRFRVIKVDSVNAFALPGGYVFIHRGLLEKADSAEEVAGVLAHEVQHVLLRHGTKRVVRKMGLFLALRLLIGGDMGGFLARGAASLASLKYDRDEETEADMGGLKLLYKARLDPEGMPRFFEKMAAEEQKLGTAGKALLPILSDHPLSSERLARITAYIRRHPKPKDRVSVSGFKAVKGLCDPRRVSDPDKDLLPEPVRQKAEEM